MEEMWAEARTEFEKICPGSLQGGGINTVKTLDDVQRQIESANKVSYCGEEKSKREKAKSTGLQSLKLFKMLVGTAAQAAGFVRTRLVALSIAAVEPSLIPRPN